MYETLRDVLVDQDKPVSGAPPCVGLSLGFVLFAQRIGPLDSALLSGPCATHQTGNLGPEYVVVEVFACCHLSDNLRKLFFFSGSPRSYRSAK